MCVSGKNNEENLKHQTSMSSWWTLNKKLKVFFNEAQKMTSIVPNNLINNRKVKM